MADNGLRVLKLVTNWGERELHYADPNNKLRPAIQDILSGKAYPATARPQGYVLDTIVDVGANIGASALHFLTQTPRRMICFEPSAENYGFLKQNLTGLANVETYQFGLFSRDCDVPLYTGRHQQMQNSVIKSIETGDAYETIKLRRASSVLSELNVDRISVLKIDTEGCEVPILNDIAAMLPRVDMLYLEYHSEQDRRDIDTMLAAGFILATAEAKCPHRGVNLYLAKRMVDGVPIYGAMALPRPN
ncbi:MAG TPA: FkbM family methyltransferase [Magnetospirillaceae bacterium]|jgi:FkbM family methyltransferase